MEIKTRKDLYKKHSSVSMNGILKGRLDVPFNIMEDNYGKHAYRISKNHIIGTVEPKISSVKIT